MKPLGGGVSPELPFVRMARKPLTPRGVARMREREASVGLDAGDDAAQWLAENDPPQAPKTPKAAKKSVTLHRFRQGRGRS